MDDIGRLFGTVVHYRQLDKLAQWFASRENADTIQRLLAQAVERETGSKIPHQNDHDLVQIMGKAYMSYLPNRTGKTDFDLERLNNMVLNLIVPSAISNFVQWQRYVPTIDQVAMPMPHPVSTNLAGRDGRNAHDMTSRIGILGRSVGDVLSQLPPTYRRYEYKADVGAYDDLTPAPCTI